jgi:5-dehydro-2-deoxygluconokinase
MPYDLITIGRVSMDLFAEDIGAPFPEINSFATGVGGSPSNIAMGASRLGLRTALLTAVGKDEVGKFVLRYLQQERVDTQFIPVKAGSRTGMAVVGVQPPDRFPLVFYRENPADIHLTIDDARRLPFGDCRALLLSGSALSRGTCRDATLFAAEQARSRAVTVFMDLDLRPDQWSHPRAFGLNVRGIWPSLDVVIGTEEEFYAALAPEPEEIVAGAAVTDAQRAELEGMIQKLQSESSGPHTFVMKRGSRGVTVYSRNSQPVHVSGFAVEVVNTVGAGDGFASGLLYGYLQGWEWSRSAQVANACGAIVVTRHGCAQALPNRQEVRSFLEQRTGEIWNI